MVLCVLAALASERPLLDERYSYGQARVPLRVGADMVAIPASARDWRAREWGVVLGFTGATVGLMLPPDLSLDVRLDRWILETLDPHVPDIWGVPMQLALWGGMATGGLAAWGVGAWTGRPRLAECMSLMLEAFSVSQLYHVTIKVLLGREGPTDGEGLGVLGGPAMALAVYPAGTPSGHAATLYSLLAVAEHYLHPPWYLRVPAHLVAGGLIAMHVVNHRHFLSDSLWGAFMGYAVGSWVVAERSSERVELQAGPGFVEVRW